ncbi:hypothetical protein VNO78_07317 [Psophocarpus tetragonolobus]|uniref:Uncharacterized protein n=1 Tax=Psophocarpus tetragonolobus TaxID=3891 RepID=A0AAN9SSV3_PSOTE
MGDGVSIFAPDVCHGSGLLALGLAPNQSVVHVLEILGNREEHILMKRPIFAFGDLALIYRGHLSPCSEGVSHMLSVDYQGCRISGVLPSLPRSI